jgi:hypothetical protein
MQMLLGPDTAQQSQKENKETAGPNQQPIFGFVISQKQSQEERGTDQQTAVEVEESKMSHAVVVVRSTPLNVSVARRRILTCTDHMNKLLSWQRKRPGRQTSTIANPCLLPINAVSNYHSSRKRGGTKDGHCNLLSYRRCYNH